MADYNSVKRKIGQVIVSCPRYLKMTIPGLLRDYKEIHREPLPYRKFKHHDVISLLKEMDDMVVIQEDPETSGIYVEYKKGYNDVLDTHRAIIQKDKIPSDSKKHIRRMKNELYEYSNKAHLLPFRRYKERSYPLPETPCLEPTNHFFERVTALIDGASEIWSLNLLQMYMETYGVELPLKMYRYSDVGALVDDLDHKKLIKVIRSRLSNNHRLLPYREPTISPRAVLDDIEIILTQHAFGVPVEEVCSLYSKVFPTKDLSYAFSTSESLVLYLKQNGFNVVETTDHGKLVFALDNPSLPPVAFKYPQELCLELEDRDNFVAYVIAINSLADMRVMWLEDYERYQEANVDLSNHLAGWHHCACWDFTPRRLYTGQLLAILNSSHLWERAVVCRVSRHTMYYRTIDTGRNMQMSLPLTPSRVQLLPERFASEPVFSRLVSMQAVPEILKENDACAVQALDDIIRPSLCVTVWPSSDKGARLPDNCTMIGLQVTDERTGLSQDVRALMVELVAQSRQH